MRKASLIAVLSLIILTSCDHFGRHVSGDGNVVKQNRSFSNFNGIDVSGGIDVLVTQDSSYSVQVEVDNNLQEFIEVEKDGDLLRIHQRNNTNLDPTKGKVIVYVSAPAFRELHASGACNISSQNGLASSNELGIHLSGSCDVDVQVNAPKVSVDASGACTIKLKGQTKDFSVDGSGSIDVKAFDLLSENTDIDISGASDVEVYASVKLTAGASGASHVRYKGNGSVSTDISGAGSVRKVE
jgi:Putative auto-transporter adhesin, head GIN domain